MNLSFGFDWECAIWTENIRTRVLVVLQTQTKRPWKHGVSVLSLSVEKEENKRYLLT